MRSPVAERLARESRSDLKRLSPDERIRLALRLGERDVELYCAAHGVGREEAIRTFRRNRQRGRRLSRSALGLDE